MICFLYEWLQKCGLADDVQVKEDDRKEAFARYMQRVARGMINQYTAFQFAGKEPKARKLILRRLRLPGKRRL